MDAPCVVLFSGQRPDCDASLHGRDDLWLWKYSDKQGKDIGVHNGQTSFIPESTDIHFTVLSSSNLWCDVPGKASAKARTRIRARECAFKSTTASAEGYI
jgi:hypothetical protein